MNKKLMIMAFSLVMLSGCAGGNNAAEETVSDTIAAAVETTTEITAEETTAAETEPETTTKSTAEETTETETEPETTSGSTAEETVKSEETAAAVTADGVHEWENIDYTSEFTAEDIESSGRIDIEYKPFYENAVAIVGSETVVNDIKANSEILQSLLQSGEEFYYTIGCIYGDFDKDGEQEYLVAIDYGRGFRNDVVIVDNDEIVYRGTPENGVDDFTMVRVGEYYKADPYILTNDNYADYIKYLYTDYTVNSDNVFIGARVTDREAINFYYQISFDVEKGYSVKLIRRAGWVTNYGEDEDGNIIGRQFVEENF